MLIQRLLRQPLLSLRTGPGKRTSAELLSKRNSTMKGTSARKDFPWGVLRGIWDLESCHKIMTTPGLEPGSLRPREEIFPIYPYFPVKERKIHSTWEVVHRFCKKFPCGSIECELCLHLITFEIRYIDWLLWFYDVSLSSKFPKDSCQGRELIGIRLTLTHCTNQPQFSEVQ